MFHAPFTHAFGPNSLFVGTLELSVKCAEKLPYVHTNNSFPNTKYDPVLSKVSLSSLNILENQPTGFIQI